MYAKDKIVVLSFLVFGTLNSLIVTMMLARKSVGRDGIDHYFDHAYIITLMNIMGKAVCMIPYIMKKVSAASLAVSGSIKKFHSKFSFAKSMTFQTGNQ